MRSDDFATARPYPPSEECEPEAQPAPGNVFTPISAADRLRGRPRRLADRHHQTRVMPPLMPGQQYGTVYQEKDPYWEDAFEESAHPPEGEEYPAGAETWEQGFYAPPATHNGPEAHLIDKYQQSYWNHLREAAPSQSSPVETDAFHVPAYLRNPDPGILPGSTMPYDPSAAYPAYGPINDWHPAGPWAGEDAEFSPYATPYMDEPVEYAPVYQHEPPYEEPFAAPAPPSPEAPLGLPYAQPVAGKGLSLAARGKQAFLRAFTTNHEQGGPPKSFAKVAAVCAITVMLAFCLIEMGKIALSMMHNEAEMKTVREEYYALSGQDLTRSAHRVELLPPGVTFAPTATPGPVAVAPQADALVEEQPETNAEPSSALNQRTKESQYPNNPLSNIREALKAPLENNADIVGHLRIEGVVDEYVVQRNNTYYLTHNARGSGDAAGAVFVDESCGIKTPPENLLLRGQGSMAGKVLATLLNYENGGAEYVRQHALIRMDTLYEEGEYVIFAVIAASSDPQSPNYFNYAGYPSFQSDWHMEEYVRGARQHSLYEIPVDVQPSDRLLTISTLGTGAEKECMVIMARKLRTGETVQSLSKALSAIRAV